MDILSGEKIKPEILHNFNQLIEAANKISTKEEADDLITKIWDLQSDVTNTEYVEFIDSKSYLRLIDAIFKNINFVAMIKETMSTRDEIRRRVSKTERFKELLKNTLKGKRKMLTNEIINDAKESNAEFLLKMSLIKEFLAIAFLPLLNLIDTLDARELRGVIKASIKSSITIEDKYGIQRIAFFCSEILDTSEYNSKIIFTKFVYRKIFIPHLTKTVYFARAILVLSVQMEIISESFIKQTSAQIDETSSISIQLRNIYNITEVSERAMSPIRYILREDEKNLNAINQFFDKFLSTNEHILIANLRLIAKDFNSENFVETVLDKIKNANNTLTALKNFVEPRLQAFSGKKEKEFEWSNKIYLNTIKLLSVLFALDKATDSSWKISVAVRELHLWVQEGNEIINKNILLDDWSEVIQFLNQEIENMEIEWKSTFYIPLEGDGKQIKVKSLLEMVADTILALLNTGGGTIIVGIVEKPEKVNKRFQDFLYHKNGYTFFNLSAELDLLKTSLDEIRRSLQQELGNLSGAPIGKFDIYWSLIPLYLKINDEEILLVKIQVQKMNEPFISKENEKIFIRKRIHGGNRYVDPREEFDLILKERGNILL